MREITTHRVNENDTALRIFAVDEIEYRIEANEPGRETSFPFQLNIDFQHGIFSEGVNGITDAALLAIVEDRLRAMKPIPRAYSLHQYAVTYIGMALAQLKRLSESIAARSVEGTAAGKDGE